MAPKTECSLLHALRRSNSIHWQTSSSPQGSCFGDLGGFCFFNCEELGYDAMTGLVCVVQPRNCSYLSPWWSGAGCVQLLVKSQRAGGVCWHSVAVKIHGLHFWPWDNDIWKFHSQTCAWGRGFEEKHTLSHGSVGITTNLQNWYTEGGREGVEAG